MVKTTVNIWLEISITFRSVEPSLIEGRSMAMITQLRKMKNRTTLSNHGFPISELALTRVLKLTKISTIPRDAIKIEKNI